MKRIPLSQGRVALISDQDWSLVRKYKWYAIRGASGIWYAQCHVGKSTTYMHRMIMGNPKCDVDHRNRNGCDNQRRNLRRATRTFNMGNRGPTRVNSSGYKGVFRKRGHWIARIVRGGIKFHLGMFYNKRKAALAYAKAARRLYGRFARTK